MGGSQNNLAMPTEHESRRWTVIASGLLCGLLALVVIYTSRGAFFSPLALLVVAAIGFAALLLELRLRERDRNASVRQPMLLNLAGILAAIAALLAEFLHWKAAVTQVLILSAIGIFGISGAIILHGLRKQRPTTK